MDHRTKEHTRTLVILSWNAGGVVGRKTAELNALLFQHRVDIALIQEIQLLSHHRWTVPGYKVLRNDRATAPGMEGRRGGGTAILLAEGINATLSDVSEHQQHGLETTSAIVETSYGPVQIASLYLPPKHRFRAACVEQTSLHRRTTIAGGDLNAKHPSWGSTHRVASGRTLRSWADANNIQIFSPKEPTYFTSEGRGNVLDIFLVTSLPAPKA
ncbi:hypothetical protein J437_LFUL004410, partial [Ladona fulva]